MGFALDFSEKVCYNCKCRYTAVYSVRLPLTLGGLSVATSFSEKGILTACAFEMGNVSSPFSFVCRHLRSPRMRGGGERKKATASKEQGEGCQIAAGLPRSKSGSQGDGSTRPNPKKVHKPNQEKRYARRHAAKGRAREAAQPERAATPPSRKPSGRGAQRSAKRDQASEASAKLR